MNRLKVFKQYSISLSLNESKKINESNELTIDSRHVKKNSTFIAIKGSRFDGHDFIKNIIDINCILIVEKGFKKNYTHNGQATIIEVKNTKQFANEYAPIFYNYPSLHMKIIGITGTNGKTSSTYLLESLYQTIGKKVGVIGTINTRIGKELFDTSLTTPHAVDLQHILLKMKNKNVNVVIMEVSSHAITLGRIHGVEFDSVIWTNFSQDHIDFHKTMDHYLQTKLKLFDILATSSKKEKKSIIFNESQYIEIIKKRISDHQLKSYYFGENVNNPNDAKGIIQDFLLSGMNLIIHFKHIKHRIHLKKIGHYNLMNTLGCLLEFEHSHPNELSLETIYSIFNKVQIPGRLESIENNKDALITIDYAHTPDALENVLNTLKQLPHNKLICIFGCGGDRDTSKRQVMGKISEKYSDISIITSDNPRTEDPMEIIQMIQEGIKKTKKQIIIEPNRKKAIEIGVHLLSKNDILLIAGKGHETYQIIGNKTIDFDDKLIVKNFL